MSGCRPEPRSLHMSSLSFEESEMAVPFTPEGAATKGEGFRAPEEHEEDVLSEDTETSSELVKY